MPDLPCNGCQHQFNREISEFDDHYQCLRLCAAFYVYDNDRKKTRYAKGPTERLDLIADFAYRMLPEKISEKAVPSESQLKRLPIATEPKIYKTEPGITDVCSLGPAFIKTDWKWCGYDHAAREMGMSKSKLEKEIEAGRFCRPDIWNKLAWFDPSSYHLP